MLPARSVWLDARSTQNVENPERGIARFVAEHARALLELAPEVIGSIRLDPAHPIPAPLQPIAGSGLFDWRSDGELSRVEPPLIYHIPSPFELAPDLEEILPWWVRRAPTRKVVTLHDLIPLIFRDRYLDPDRFVDALYTARLGLIRVADQVLTNSRSTADDAIEHLGIAERKITVIDSGVTGRLASLAPSRGEAEARLATSMPDIRRGFLLYVGGDDPRKNLDGMIEAFALLPEPVRRAHQLVIVCRLRPWRKRELAARARELGIAGADLVLTGFVEDRELAALYRACSLFVFPSLYEGAGLPILEAMSCGAPVAASGVSAIPEILGNPEATFDPAQPSEIAACLDRVLADESLIDSLRQRSRRRVELFTWRRVAERSLEGYERALRQPPPAPPRRERKRLAVVTPWPPQPSGVATHSRRLVAELADRVDVDVIVPDEDEPIEFDRSLEPRVRIRSAADFDWARDLVGYDRVLYTLGGSHFHAHAFEAMMNTPGAALAHDVRLVGIYLDLERRRFPDDPHWFERKLVRMYGDRIERRDLRLIRYDDLYADYGVFMTQEVQGSAQQMIVHSDYQVNVLRRDSPGSLLPTDVVPHGVPAPPVVPDSEEADVEEALIVTYGVVSLRAKRMRLLLEGFGRLAERREAVRLAVVGETSERDRVQLERMLLELGIRDRVDLRGRVDSGDYWRTLRSADLAVQLRGGINGGEASGAVCDCIAARLPTIVSEIGWFAELPEPVVLPVPTDCSPEALADRMAGALDDPDLRRTIAAAQDDYAAENSFARVAERYVELLAL